MVRLKGLLNIAVFILAAAMGMHAQMAAPQVTAIKAGRLFDPKAGKNLSNQVVLISGDKITEVGPASSVKIPADAKIIDLSQATVLPGLIDGHVHLTDAAGGLMHQQLVALNSATRSLNAGFTTLVAMGSHGGGYADVELKKGIETGLVKGPRLLTAGPIINITMPGSAPFPLEYVPFHEDTTANGVDEIRAAVREHAHYGVDHIKIHTTGPFYFKSNGEMVNEALFSLEELKALVDEAHRRNLFVASHTYGGDGLKWAVQAGVDDIQHAVAPDEDDIKGFVQNKIPITSTLLDQRQDEPGDLAKWAPYSRWRLMEQSWKQMLNAGVILGFGSGSAPPPGRVYNKECNCSHGVQAEHLVVMVKWGATPLYALRTATTVNSGILHLDKVGTIEKGKYADIIAVSGDPLQDITEMQRVKFVMKGGEVFRNDMSGTMMSAK